MSKPDEVSLKVSIAYVESCVKLWDDAAKEAAWQVERYTRLLKKLEKQEKQRLNGQGG